ncbi:MAG: YjgP/YjgQ family permease [Sphingobacteriales bacterium]|nr:MAG: YjgP/YjgQ family permease [Sphingobacteriales bacterium]
MIKKLDQLILKAFVGPFIATFFITLFVLVLQFFWLYIDDIVGKGLDLGTIGRLMSYVSATVVPLALPLAVLLSSIMTFGNLGETFELVAIKSAGISLSRFMRPLLVACLFICGIAFLFNNYIIPVANLKLNTLKYDIIVSKPAFDIKEGMFYDRIDGYVIKIGKKEKDGTTIHDIVVYEKNYGLQDNVIFAKHGQMRVSDDKRFLEFHLQDGWRYSEKGERNNLTTEYVRMGFKNYKKVFDLSSFKLNKTEDSVFKDNWRMLSIRQLNKSIDSLVVVTARYKSKVKTEMTGYLSFSKYLDSNWSKHPPAKKRKKFEDIIADTAKTYSIEKGITQAGAIKSALEVNAVEYDSKRKDLRFHLIEWHRKFTMSVACLVLFLIGAPLGSIIRKGGIGTPLVFAVIFFVIFFLLNNFGEKFVKEDVLSPLGGMWVATIVLIPMGLFLTVKAMRDSQLFNSESYLRVFMVIKGFFKKTSREETTNNM